MIAIQPLIPTPSKFVRRIARAFQKLRRRVLLPRVQRPVLETIEGFMFVSIPTVFNPVIFNAGRMLGRAVEAANRPKTPDKNRALDMGCGAGIVGAYLARAGYIVTSVDINPDAVRVTRANAILNDMEDMVTVKQSDLFDELEGEKFDLVCFSPPYFEGPPKDDRLARAFWSENLMDRFARELPKYLSAGGTALIHLSTDGDSEKLLDQAEKEGFEISIAARKNLLNEIMTVYQLRIVD
jgi:HemK-related putative methylase